MRIYYLELKRILKSRRSIILLLIALLASIGMAWLPVMFVDNNQYDAKGNKVAELNGLKAIRHIQKLQAPYDGEVTQEKLKEALKIYQITIAPYGEDSLYDGKFPPALYQKIEPVQSIIGRLPEAFADLQTGLGKSKMDIPIDDMDHFYERTKKRLNSLMDIEEKDYPSAKENAFKQYSKVKTPFKLYSGYTRDAFDYIELTVFFLVILCAAAVTPTFSNEYQTGADSILRCTKHGRSKLAVVKISAALTISVIAFAVCISLHLLISDFAFGTECIKTSMQMLFSVSSLPAINLGKLQAFVAMGGLISLLATVSFTMFISAQYRDALTVIMITIAVCLFPMFVFQAFGANWLSSVLPSSGIGMSSNNFLYQLIDIKYLHIGHLSIWTPYVMMVSAVIEIPIFIFLAVRTYCKHQVV